MEFLNPYIPEYTGLSTAQLRQAFLNIQAGRISGQIGRHEGEQRFDAILVVVRTQLRTLHALAGELSQALGAAEVVLHANR